MELQGRYRHELKFQISQVEYEAIRRRLQPVMQRDVHAGADGHYAIHSIYFDNFNDKALREKVNGVQQREKFRIRYYNNNFSYITLEKKIKHNNLCMKVDATNMKEALVYDMFQYMGADASLYNYAKISVNGDYCGVYLALEGVEDSFILRNYGTQSGELYKPEGVGGGGGDMQSDGEMPGGDMQGGIGGSGGADLNYSDDDLDSYSTIWDGEITDTSKSDHKRVVKALKNISEGIDLEDYMDIDNLLKYMAVHVFSVNEDSLSGSMAHNYYLYEYDGKLNLIPWDYNLAWGGMGGMGNAGNTDQATSVVNDAIDDSFSSTNFFDTLMADETYHEQYYTYMCQLVDEYVNGGAFEAFYNRVRSQIDELVETDPNAFYTYDEYMTAAETLYQVIMLRAESISGQLDGTIPSTSEAQSNSDALIDASSLDISAMGSMNSGGGGMQGGPDGDFDGEIPQGGQNGPNAEFNGEMPHSNPNGAPGDFDPAQMDENNQNLSQMDENNQNPPAKPDNFNGNDGGTPSGNIQSNTQ